MRAVEGPAVDGPSNALYVRHRIGVKMDLQTARVALTRCHAGLLRLSTELGSDLRPMFGPPRCPTFEKKTRCRRPKAPRSGRGRV